MEGHLRGAKVKGHACMPVWFWKDGCWWMCIWSRGRRAVQGRGTNEAVCSQVSAGSDAGRTYRWVTYAKARVVSIPFLFLRSHPLVVITGRLLQCITPVMIGKVEKRLQMPDLCP